MLDSLDLTLDASGVIQRGACAKRLTLLCHTQQQLYAHQAQLYTHKRRHALLAPRHRFRSHDGLCRALFHCL